MPLLPRATRLQTLARQSRPSFNPTLPFTRAAGTMAAAKKEWLVIVPDYPGALDKRLEVRAQHFQGLRDQPNLKWGGGMLATHEQPGDKLQLNGSAMTVEADSRDEVVSILRNDIYAKSGVWNVDLAQIIPVELTLDAVQDRCQGEAIVNFPRRL